MGLENKGCRCQDCGSFYRVDVLVPSPLWDEIRPTGKSSGAGLLCRSCIVKRIEARGVFDAFELVPANALRKTQATERALEEVVKAIEAGQQSVDHRGRVYRQEFGEAFVQRLRGR
jgi:hypothetical protein